MGSLLVLGALLLCPARSGAAPTPTYTPAQGSGGAAFVATLGGGGAQGAQSFYFGGTTQPTFWVTSRDYVSCDFAMAIDAAPGTGKSWSVTALYAPLGAAENCNDITNWTSVALCTIRDDQKSCELTNVAMPITAPTCFRGYAAAINSPANREGGTASFHCFDATGQGPTHLQGGGSLATSTAFYGGQVARSTNDQRAYWLATAAPLKRCSGMLALSNAPGAAGTWHLQLAASTSALASGQNCANLSYTATSDVCTVTGSNKRCSWLSPVALSVPLGGCLQLRGTCSGTCAAITGGQYGLDCSTDTASPYNAGGPSYESAGSGALDSGHVFGASPWGISDALYAAYPVSQHYWIAPSAGLHACAGGFTFESAIANGQRYDVSIRVSNTVPTSTQSCVDLSYTDTPTTCSLTAGDRSCVFPLTAVTIPGGSCFALGVVSNNITAVDNAFNWSADCVTNAPALPTNTPTRTPVPNTPRATDTPAAASTSTRTRTAAAVSNTPTVTNTPTPAPSSTRTRTATGTVVPALAATLIGQSVPAAMTAGQPFSVSVTMQNSGGTTWTAERAYRLGAINPYDNSTWGMNRVGLASGESIAPGQQKTFTWTVTAPVAAGTYNFQWRMVQDGVAWFGATSTNVAVTVTAASGPDATYVAQSVPSSVTAGQPFSVSVTMQNSGAATWTAAGAYRLGATNPYDNSTWGMNRVGLASGESIAPGQQKTFTWTVTAPASAGTYNFQWRMVQDGVAWFGDLTAKATVSVGP